MLCSRPMKSYLYTGLVGLLLGLPLSAQAQQEAEYVLRTYEVGDLTLNVSDRPYGESAATIRQGIQAVGGGGFGGGGGGFGGGGGLGGGGQFSVPEVANRQPLYLAQFGGGGGGGRMAQVGAPAPTNTIDNLWEVIVATVDPESWSENGGNGTLQAFGTAMVVWQTEPVHQRIEQLLQALRAGTGDRRTVKVDARWLLLNSDDLAQLTAVDEHGIDRIDRQVLDQLTRRPTSIRGLTNCFSGQLVYVVSGTQRNVVEGYIPVVGSVDSPQPNEQFVAQNRPATFRFAADTQTVQAHAAGVGYQPIVQKKNFGALLEIRPTLVPGSKSAVVDLTATITVPAGNPLINEGNPIPSQTLPVVDRIAIETQQLATTLRLPLAKPVVVGGLTFKPASVPMDHRGAPAAGGAAAALAESPQLYLILQIQ
ncbi:MAG: hypothetical protein ACR2NU_13930 [Aeoliella sp.]